MKLYIHTYNVWCWWYFPRHPRYFQRQFDVFDIKTNKFNIVGRSNRIPSLDFPQLPIKYANCVGNNILYKTKENIFPLTTTQCSRRRREWSEHKKLLVFNFAPNPSLNHNQSLIFATKNGYKAFSIKRQLAARCKTK